MKRHVVRAFSLLAAFAWCLAGGFQGLSAAEFRSEERPVVEADEVIEDDLYMFGDEVTIDGEVRGDVIVFGRLIRLNGSVEGDFIAVGQAIVISGEVGDDARMGGQVLRIDKEAEIVDDVIAGGFSLEKMEASSIGGDLVYGGYQALLAGGIGGDVLAAMSNCEINGQIDGDVNVAVEGDQAGPQAYTSGSPPPISLPSVPPGLTIRDSAQINGGLKYYSRDEADIEADAAIAGEIEHERPPAETTRPPTPAEKAFRVLREYASLLIIGLCVVLVAPTWTRRISDNVKTRPLASLGLGVVGVVGFFVLLPVVMVVTVALAVLAGVVNLTDLVPVVIVLGLSGGILLAVGFWFLTVYLAKIILSFFAGRWLLGLATPALGENRFLALLIGLVLLALLSSVPYLGSIIGWLVGLIGLGAVVGWLFWKRPEEPFPAEQAT